MKRERKDNNSNVKPECKEKVEALRKFFLEIVDRNFVARCRYVQLFFEPVKCPILSRQILALK